MPSRNSRARPRLHAHVRAPLAAAALVAAAVTATTLVATPPVAAQARDVARVRLEGLESPFLLPLGRSTRLGVTAWDGRGALVQAAPRWRVDDPATLAVDPATGTLRALRRGFARLGATVGDTTVWWTIAVAPPADSVALRVVRRGSGASGVLVSSAVPLVPGALRPGDERRVRLVVDGKEPAVRVSPLASRHADGSLRAVLVQFRLPAGGPPPRATLVIGAPRTAPSFAGERPGAVPDAALLPTDPDYLIATDIVGPTLSARETAWLGAEFRRYDKDFGPASDKLWASEGAKWEGNYYDRALIYYAMWARTGNPDYWWRGTEQAATYRQKYLEPNNMMSSPHWAQMEGLEKHYLLTGDETSRLAVVKVAEVFTGFLPEYYTPGGGDLRIMARFIHGAVLAWRLTPGGDTPAGAQPRDWAARIDFLLDRLRPWQRPDGSYPTAVTCNTTMNYQVGLLNDALIKTYTYYRADPAIVTQVKRAVDYLWRTQWVGGSSAFQYLSGGCANVGGTDPTGDLTGLMVSPFGWLWRRTGDRAYRFAGDRVFAASVAQAYLVGSKQFNQAYASSYHYLGWR